MAGTALTQVHLALVGALDGDAALDTALGVSASRPHAVFNVRAPQGFRPPYLTIGDAADGPSLLESFDTERTDGRTRIHLWTRAWEQGDPAGLVTGLDTLAVDALYAHVRRLVHRQRLALTGYAMTVEGEVRLIATFPDPDEPVMHGVVDYAYTTEPTP